MSSGTCAFRDIAGPLRAAYQIPRRRDTPELFAHIRCLYVERAQCTMRGHWYHVVCSWDAACFGQDGWSYYRGSSDLFRELLIWNTFGFAPGYTGQEPAFVLLPSQTSPKEAP